MPQRGLARDRTFGGLALTTRTHSTDRPPQYAEAQRHLEAHQEEPSFLLALAFILAQTTQDQVRDEEVDRSREGMWFIGSAVLANAASSSPSFLGQTELTPQYTQVADDVRQLAGLLLKNYVRLHAEPFVRGEIRGAAGATQQQGAELRDYVKHQALLAAREAHHSGVRNVAGILITTLATHTLRAGLQLGQAWPELFPALLDMLGSGQKAVSEWVGTHVLGVRPLFVFGAKPLGGLVARQGRHRHSLIPISSGLPHACPATHNK